MSAVQQLLLSLRTDVLVQSHTAQVDQQGQGDKEESEVHSSSAPPLKARRPKTGGLMKLIAAQSEKVSMMASDAVLDVDPALQPSAIYVKSTLQQARLRALFEAWKRQLLAAFRLFFWKCPTLKSPHGDDLADENKAENEQIPRMPPFGFAATFSACVNACDVGHWTGNPSDP